MFPLTWRRLFPLVFLYGFIATTGSTAQTLVAQAPQSDSDRTALARVGSATLSDDVSSLVRHISAWATVDYGIGLMTDYGHRFPSKRYHSETHAVASANDPCALALHETSSTREGGATDRDVALDLRSAGAFPVMTYYQFTDAHEVGGVFAMIEPQIYVVAIESPGTVGARPSIWFSSKFEAQLVQAELSRAAMLCGSPNPTPTLTPVPRPFRQPSF